MTRFCKGYNVDSIESYGVSKDAEGCPITHIYFKGGGSTFLHGDYSLAIDGAEHIVSVFTAEYDLYAVYRDVDHEGYFEWDDVHELAVCANGEIRPLVLCDDGFYDFADSTSNYEGCFSNLYTIKSYNRWSDHHDSVKN